jgi:hypothetical protein
VAISTDVGAAYEARSMTQRNHDELAAALSGLNSGEIVDDAAAGDESSGEADHVDLAGAASPASMAPAPPMPKPPPPARAKVRPTPAAKPIEPARAIPPSLATARAASAAQRVPPGRPREWAPIVPPVAAPVETPPPAEPAEIKASVTRDAELERQAAALAAPTPPVAEIPEADPDDWVMIPALAPTAPSSRPAARIPPAASDGSAVRRTLIPILLTLGGLFPACGAARFVVDPASPLAGVPLWLTAALCIAGPVFWVLAVVNMMQIRRLRQREAL